MSYVKILFFVGAVSTLFGCQTPPPLPATPDPASVQLDVAMAPKTALKPIGPETRVAVPVYGAKTSVSFLGDAAVLLADAAKGQAGWTFQITGPQPRLPIYVQVSVKEVPFADFLKDVAEQLGQRADIALNGKAIELRYRGNN